jgi:hypothetical protein
MSLIVKDFKERTPGTLLNITTGADAYGTADGALILHTALVNNGVVVPPDASSWGGAGSKTTSQMNFAVMNASNTSPTALGWLLSDLYVFFAPGALTAFRVRMYDKDGSVVPVSGPTTTGVAWSLRCDASTNTLVFERRLGVDPRFLTWLPYIRLGCRDATVPVALYVLVALESSSVIQATCSSLGSTLAPFVPTSQSPARSPAKPPAKSPALTPAQSPVWSPAMTPARPPPKASSGYVGLSTAAIIAIAVAAAVILAAIIGGAVTWKNKSVTAKKSGR